MRVADPLKMPATQPAHSSAPSPFLRPRNGHFFVQMLLLDLRR